ncbi:hypothetical protein [Haloarcula marina]|uniref:hypothetical protein n=1 Tax=Haloarcula marina TaxID=2961574 RepID=UPI0020B84FA4|nr:hypothetical protein [Halomicroarcula marina]
MRNATSYRTTVTGRSVVSYGPSAHVDGDGYVLSFSTDAGRVEILVDERAMYDLWSEVRGVPWPEATHEQDEHDRLVRRVLHAANDADTAMLREMLRTLCAEPY